MSNILAVVPDPSSNVASAQLSSLAAAMQDLNQVAIVRYVRTDNSSPRLGALVPNAKGYLYFTQVFNYF